MPLKYSKPVYEARHPSSHWDAVLAAGLILIFAVHFEAHQAGYGLLAFVSGLALLTIVYGAFIEPRFLTVRRFEVGEGKRVVTLAFLSDIHVGPYKGMRWIERLTRKVNALAPDFVLLGGDYLYDRAGQEVLLEPFRGLKAKAGVFAILGNHDGAYGIDEVSAQFAKMGIPLLRNQAVRVEAKDIDIVGMNDDWYDFVDFEAAERGVRPGEPSIMLIHNPDLAPHAARYKPTLMLSGHTHGGQIRLPILGPIPRLPHWLGRKYDRGLFHFDGVPLIIGQGVGESGPRARLFCPPQIVFVTLRY